MKYSIILTLATITALTIWGCKPEDKPIPAAKENAAHQCDDPSHDHAHDHETVDTHKHNEEPGSAEKNDTADDGHDHDQQTAQSHAHGGDGKKYELGKKQAGDFTMEVTQIGTFTGSSTELAFEVTVTGPSNPEAVRALVKSTNGSESLKSKADKTGDTTYHLHISELPKKVEESKLLVEVSTGQGKVTAEFAVQH